MTVPERPLLYHITHVDNLASIVSQGGLLSDAALLERGAVVASIGMRGIKQRRLQLPVRCHPGINVGDCVPFYFCPRSIMIYLIHRANHAELGYRAGQEPIVHLECDLVAVVQRAEREQRKWSFTLSNAGASYAEFQSSLDRLGDINWDAVAATDFRPPPIKEGKQAEFLVHEFVPWDLVVRIGVHSAAMAAKVAGEISAAPHQPRIDVVPEWYY